MTQDAYTEEKLRLANIAMGMLDTDPGDPPPFWRVPSLIGWVFRYRAYRSSNIFKMARSSRERLYAIASEMHRV